MSNEINPNQPSFSAVNKSVSSTPINEESETQQNSQALSPDIIKAMQPLSNPFSDTPKTTIDELIQIIVDSILDSGNEDTRLQEWEISNVVDSVDNKLSSQGINISESETKQIINWIHNKFEGESTGKIKKELQSNNNLRQEFIKFVTEDLYINIENTSPINNATKAKVDKLFQNINIENDIAVVFSSDSITDDMMPDILNRLKDMPKLQELSFEFCKQITKMPPEIGNLTNLKVLSFDHTKIEKISPQIGNLKSLEGLYLTYNGIPELPPEIGNLKSLKKMSLIGHNKIKIPKEIEGLTNLETLYFNGCSGGEIPKEICNIKNLKVLTMSSNEISEIPPEIGKLENLVSLYLDSNQIKELPKEIGNLKNLKMLNLDSNPLTLGSFPKSMERIDQLEAIYLSRNNVNAKYNTQIKKYEIDFPQNFPKNIRALIESDYRQ